MSSHVKITGQSLGPFSVGSRLLDKVMSHSVVGTTEILSPMALVSDVLMFC